jgi:hypothetical protein
MCLEAYDIQKYYVVNISSQEWPCPKYHILGKQETPDIRGIEIQKKKNPKQTSMGTTLITLGFFTYHPPSLS